MLQLTVAGRVGRDAEYRTAGSGELCSFSIAGESGYGDKKQTIWIDVTRWGKGAEGLAKHVKKGTSVAVTGELSTREHDGKTYIQVRADKVTLLGGKSDGGQSVSGKQPDHGSGSDPADDDFSDEIPF